MTKHVKSAIFDYYVEAENAVKNLRAAGVEADHISVIAREGSDTYAVDGDGNKVTTNAVKYVVCKAAAGAGVGALLGVAAMVIPDVGSFVAAGAIAQAAAVEPQLLEQPLARLQEGLRAPIPIKVYQVTIQNIMLRSFIRAVR